MITQIVEKHFAVREIGYAKIIAKRKFIRAYFAKKIIEARIAIAL